MYCLKNFNVQCNNKNITWDAVDYCRALVFLVLKKENSIIILIYVSYKVSFTCILRIQEKILTYWLLILNRSIYALLCVHDNYTMQNFLLHNFSFYANIQQQDNRTDRKRCTTSWVQFQGPQTVIIFCFYPDITAQTKTTCNISDGCWQQ